MRAKICVHPGKIAAKAMIKLSEKRRDKLVDIIKMLLDGIENNNLAFIDTHLLDSFSIKLIVDELFVLDLTDELFFKKALTDSNNIGSYFIRNFSDDLYRNDAPLRRLLESLESQTSQQVISKKSPRNDDQPKVSLIRTGSKIRCIIEGFEVELDKTLNDNRPSRVFRKLIDSRVPISVDELAKFISGKEGKPSLLDKNLVYAAIKDLRAELGLRSDSPDNFIFIKNGQCFLSGNISVK